MVKRSLPVVAALFFIACELGPKLEDHECPPSGTDLTYQNFGQTFMNDYCQRCHASTSSSRQGAPSSFTFDTEAEVMRHAARIYARAASTNASMPIGPDDPPLAERELLAEWLACGL